MKKRKESHSSTTPRHKRGVSESKFLSLLKTPERRRLHSFEAIDAEALTDQERLSRLWHSPKPKVKLPHVGALFDHFIVAGVENHRSTVPKILFQYPINSRINVPGIEDFCFPAGVETKILSKRVSDSTLLELTHNQTYLRHPERCFVFFFQDEQAQVHYGICVHREELLESPPCFMNTILVPPYFHATTMRCYCVITKFPFFRLYFDFIFQILAVEKLTRLTTSSPTIENPTEVPFSFGSEENSNSPVVSFSEEVDLDPTIEDPREPRGLVLPKVQTTRRTLIRSNSGSSTGLLSRKRRHKSDENNPPVLFRTTSSMLSISSDSFVTSPKSPPRSPLREDESPVREGRVAGTNSPNVVHSTAKMILNKTNQLQEEDDDVYLSRSLDSRDPGERQLSAPLQKNLEISDCNPCIQAMNQFYRSDVPRKGERGSFCISEYLNSLNFDRPFFQEEEELFAEWGLPLLLWSLSFETLLSVLSAIMLEKKIVLYSNNLRLLSAMVLSLTPLIRPFVYQSVIIPLLPRTMSSMLEAPVPFLIGLTSLPSDLANDVLVLDVQNKKFISPDPVPLFPRANTLQMKCEGYLNKLRQSFKSEIPFHTSKEQLSLVENISLAFEDHFTSLFAHFHNYTICNMNDPTTPITVFIKESFLEDMPASDCAFIEPFLSTQMFFQYSDKRLRKRDEKVKFKV